MATTTAEPIGSEPIPPQTEPEQPKRGRGRPPKPPGQEEPEPEPFFLRIKNFSAVDWQETLVMYLFRCEPITDRKATGKHSNLRKYTQPVEPDDIKHEFGSGVYKLMLVGLDQNTGKYRKIEEHFFTIMDLGAPPKLALGEWVDEPRNAEWAWAKPALEAEAAKQRGGASGSGGGMPDIAMFNAVMDRIEKLNPGKDKSELASMANMVVTMMKETYGQMLTAASSSKTEMLALIDRVIAAAKPADSSPMMTLLTTLLTQAESRAAAAQERFEKMMEKMFEPKPQPSFKDQLQDTLEVARTIKGNRSSGDSTPGSGWTDVARDAIAEVSQTVRAGFQAYMVRKAAESGRKINIQQERPATRQPNPNALPQAPAASPDANSQPTAEQVDNMLEQINAQYGPLFDEIAPFLVDHFRKGWSGMEFRDWFLEEYGTKVYRQVRMMPPDMIGGIIEIRKKVAPPNVQALLQELQPPDQLVQFIQEFLSNAPVPDQDEDETPEEQAQGKSEFKEF